MHHLHLLLKMSVLLLNLCHPAWFTFQFVDVPFYNCIYHTLLLKIPEMCKTKTFIYFTHSFLANSGLKYVMEMVAKLGQTSFSTA